MATFLHSVIQCIMPKGAHYFKDTPKVFRFLIILLCIPFVQFKLLFKV